MFDGKADVVDMVLRQYYGAGGTLSLKTDCLRCAGQAHALSLFPGQTLAQILQAAREQLDARSNKRINPSDYVYRSVRLGHGAL